MSAAPAAPRSSTSMPQSSSCRALSTGSRTSEKAETAITMCRAAQTAVRNSISGWSCEPDCLQHRTQIVEAVDHNRQPGRVTAIAQIAEPKADAEDLAEEEPVVLQVQTGPHKRRQQNCAGHL